MNILSLFSRQTTVRRQMAIVLFGSLFQIADRVTDPSGPAVDLVWLTILCCGAPILVNAVRTVLNRLEIHSNMLIAVALIALIATGAVHMAADVALIVQVGLLIESVIAFRHEPMAIDDDFLPNMPDPWRSLRDGLNRWSSVIVVAVIFLAMGSFAVTQNLLHTVTLLLVLCPCTLDLIVSSAMMAHLVGEDDDRKSLTAGNRQVLLFALLASVVLHGAVIGLGVIGVIGPVEAVLYHGIARIVSVVNLNMVRSWLVTTDL